MDTGTATPGLPAHHELEALEPLTDRLTRDEWNACYFLGQEEFFRGAVKCGLCEQVAVGMGRLLEAGYEFQLLARGPAGVLQPKENAEPQREHEISCGEVATGAFDDIGRAREALHWVRSHAPGVSTQWLEELLHVYDRVHSRPPEGALATEG